MAHSRDLQSLLGELKRVSSPIQRMKLIARAWRTVRRLTPSERKEIASNLGAKELEGVLEKLGKKDDGIAPSEVLRVLENAGDEDLDPPRMRKLIRGLRDPEKRKDLLRRGLDLLQDHLDDEEVIPEKIEAQPPPPPPREEKTEAVAPAEPEPPAPVEIMPPSPVPSPALKPAPTPAPAPPARAPLPEPEQALAPPRVEASDTDRVDRLRAAPSLMARFRMLRGDLTGGGRPDPSEIRSLLSTFPEGWARRRALASLIREGLPDDVDDAIALIEDLERPADRRWCAAALIHSRDLSDKEMRRLGARRRRPAGKPGRELPR